MKKHLKVFSVWIALLLAVTGIYTCAEGNSEWDKIYALIEKETGFTREQLTGNDSMYEDGMWLFSVTIKDHPEDEDGLLVGEMDNDGNLISLSGPEKINLERQLELDLQSCFNRDDCYMRLAKICEKWKTRLDAAGEEQKAGIWDKYIRIVERGITLPPEGTLDYATAFETALKKAAEYEGWTDEMIHMFRHAISAYYELDGSPVWFVYLEQHSWFEPEYESDADMNRYKEKLKKVFAEAGQVPPRKIGILIDAFTGELKEKPMLDYVPTEFEYPDFLIRTEEAVASISGK